MKKIVFKITYNRLHNVQVKVKRWITRGRNKESENEVIKEKIITSLTLCSREDYREGQGQGQRKYEKRGEEKKKGKKKRGRKRKVKKKKKKEKQEVEEEEV